MPALLQLRGLPLAELTLKAASPSSAYRDELLLNK